MKMLMLLEVSNALGNKLSIPWWRDNAKNSIYQKSISPRNSELEKNLILSENVDREDYDENILQHLDRSGRDSAREYRNLCETVIRRVEFEDSVFEYQPPHYHQVFCKSQASNEENVNDIETSTQKCAHPGFDCVQRSRTLFVVRRKWDNDCWEPFTKEIASGCDCMWPVSTLGDISIHY